MTEIDVAVIGAGVTGLAAARALAARGHSTCVLERHARAGLDTSTHNSGVIHAGIYYPPGSLKARLCVEGRRLMYAFCARYNVPHRQSGKLIVAHDDGEVRQLEALKVRGDGNGVDGLELVDRAFIVAREPAVSGVAALWSPESGVVEAEALVKTLVTTGADAGAIFLPGTRLIGADRHADGMELRTERESIRARTVVNAAGLYADEVSRLLGGETFTIYPCRGDTSSSRRRSDRSSTRSSIPFRIRTVLACTWCERRTATSGLGRPRRSRSGKTITRAIVCRSKPSSSRRAGCSRT